MIQSMAMMFLMGLALSVLMQKIHLPRLLGFLLSGILLGPCVLGLIDDKTMMISGDLRTMALIIILIKAGLSLDLKDLKKVGRPALLMSFLPASFEIMAYGVFAPSILGLTRIEALLLGAVMGAVSPAVVVPYMVKIMEENYGTKKGIPQLILAGSSLDDVYTIVLFGTFLSMLQGKGVSAKGFLEVPVRILLGVAGGILIGKLLVRLFESRFARGNLIRNSMKVVIILDAAFFLKEFENHAPFSGLLAVITMALVIGQDMPDIVGGRLAAKFGKLWIAAEVILFVLVGAEVNTDAMLKTGPKALLMIAVALLIRMVGVQVALTGTGFTKKERLFTGIAYLPKATVQAAIGGVPLALGLPCGQTVLSLSVIAIMVTAPLGALGMEATYEKCLTRE